MPIVKRALLKLSGEALLGEKNYGVDANVIKRVAYEIKKATDTGVETAVVIGGGNIFRGIEGVSESGMNRSVADSMGMLATVMNGLALKNGFEEEGLKTAIFSAFAIEGQVERYQREKVINALSAKKVTILTGGTSNPFFTTDTAAVLRALECECDIILKGTKVDGVYSADPMKDKNALLHESLRYEDVLKNELKVMDLTAFAMAKDNKLAIRVFNMTKNENITKALVGENLGTIVT